YLLCTFVSSIISYCVYLFIFVDFFFSSRRRHTRFSRDWSSDVCSSDLIRASPASAATAMDSASTLNTRRAAGRVSENPNPSVPRDRKSTRLNSSHVKNSYAVFCLKKKI